MATAFEVTTALSMLANTIIYPNGTDNPSVCGVDVTVGTGWPIPEVLDRMLEGNTAMVTVFPRADTRNTSRGFNRWEDSEFTGDTGESVLVTKRQEKVFIVTVWAPSPEIRELLVKSLDSELSDMPRITLPDQQAMNRYRGEFTSDENEKKGLYRHDLYYAVEYATTKVQIFFAVKTNILSWNAVSNINVEVQDGVVTTTFDDGTRITFDDGSTMIEG